MKEIVLVIMIVIIIVIIVTTINYSNYNNSVVDDGSDNLSEDSDSIIAIRITQDLFNRLRNFLKILIQTKVQVFLILFIILKKLQ
jgi:ABC-type sugar transport system permease subunit